MKRMVLTICLLVFALSTNSVHAAEPPVKRRGYVDFTQWYRADQLVAEVPYRTAAVLDYDTLEPLYYYGEELVMPTASLMKMLTAGVVASQPGINWDDQIGLNWWDNEGALRPYVGPYDRFVTLKLEEEEKISVREMLIATLLPSANNAAHRLGTYVGTTIPIFAEMMRSIAQQWGLTSTQIEEPSGLSLDNVSNAKDMARAICMMLRQSEISEIAGMAEYDFSETLGREYSIRHTVGLLHQRPDMFLGAKTGFLYETRFHTAAAVRTAQGHKVCVALLSAQTRVDSEAAIEPLTRWVDSMYQWNDTVL